MLCLLILFLFRPLQPFLQMLSAIMFPVVTVVLAVLLHTDQDVRLQQQKWGLNSCPVRRPTKIASVATLLLTNLNNDLYACALQIHFAASEEKGIFPDLIFWHHFLEFFI
jgi:hypothetical protein